MFFKKEKQNRENVVNFDIEKFINMHDYKATERDLMPYEYLLDNLLIKNEITMINESNGASLIIANTLLKNGKIKKVIYLDTHNHSTLLKIRELHVFKEFHGDNLIYLYTDGTSTHKKFLEELSKNQNIGLEDVLIILDRVDDFGWRKNQYGLESIFIVLDSLKNKGATVLVNFNNQGILNEYYKYAVNVFGYKYDSLNQVAYFVPKRSLVNENLCSFLFNQENKTLVEHEGTEIISRELRHELSNVS